MQAFWNAKPDAASAEGAEKELARFLPVLEAALEGKDWLEGKFSLADVAYAPHLSLLGESSFSLAAYPRVDAWLGRLLSRPAWKKTAETVFAG
jgi:glutathione S-transferase